MFARFFESLPALADLTQTLATAPARCIEGIAWMGRQVNALSEQIGTLPARVKYCGSLAHALYKTPLCQYPKYVGQSTYAAYSLFRDRDFKSIPRFTLTKSPEIFGTMRQLMQGIQIYNKVMAIPDPFTTLHLHLADAAACITGTGRLTYSAFNRKGVLTNMEKLALINSLATTMVSGMRPLLFSDDQCTSDVFCPIHKQLEYGAIVITTVNSFCLTYHYREQIFNLVKKVIEEGNKFQEALIELNWSQDLDSPSF